MKKKFAAGGTGCIGRACSEYLPVGYDVTVFDAPLAHRDPAETACSGKARKRLKRNPKYGSVPDIIGSAWKWQQKFPEGCAA